MSQPLYRIRELVKTLPVKDAKLADKFLDERNFQGILELVESDIYKARHTSYCPEVLKEVEEIISKWLELKVNLEEYMSYLVIPEPDDMEEAYYD